MENAAAAGKRLIDNLEQYAKHLATLHGHLAARERNSKRAMFDPQGHDKQSYDDATRFADAARTSAAATWELIKADFDRVARALIAAGGKADVLWAMDREYSPKALLASDVNDVNPDYLKMWLDVLPQRIEGIKDQIRTASLPRPGRAILDFVARNVVALVITVAGTVVAAFVIRAIYIRSGINLTDPSRSNPIISPSATSGPTSQP